MNGQPSKQAELLLPCSSAIISHYWAFKNPLMLHFKILWKSVSVHTDSSKSWERMAHLSIPNVFFPLTHTTWHLPPSLHLYFLHNTAAWLCTQCCSHRHIRVSESCLNIIDRCYYWTWMTAILQLTSLICPSCFFLRPTLIDFVPTRISLTHINWNLCVDGTNKRRRAFFGP